MFSYVFYSNPFSCQCQNHFISHEFPAFKASFHPLPSAFHSNLPGGRGEIDDGTSGESVPSSISSDFPKTDHIREAFTNIRDGPREKGAVALK